MNAARRELEEQERQFAHALAALKADRKLAMEAADAKFAEDAALLEAEWAGDRRLAAYNKPSPALLALRTTAQRTLAACRFDDAAQIAARIAEREAEESEEASHRMAEDFKGALTRLRAAADAEKEAVARQAEDRIVALERKRDLALRPLRNRMQMLEAAYGRVKAIKAVGQVMVGRPKFGGSGPPVRLGTQKLILRPLPASAMRRMIGAR
jgi:hypothetical protein